MPTHQLPKATQDRRRPRLNGQAIPVMIDISSKLLRRTIPVLRMLLQRFEENRFQSAGQFTLQAGRRSLTAAADLESRSLAAPFGNNRTWPGWFLFTNNAQDLVH